MMIGRVEIDISDYYKVMNHNWFEVLRKGIWYAETRINNRNVGMHTLIRPAPDGYIVDHRDRNGLNNRWNNLRHVNWTQSNTNREMPQTEHGSGYRGVVQSPSGRYQARIRHDGRNVALGTYDTAEDAARAYDDASRKWHGEYGITNFPEGK